MNRLEERREQILKELEEIDSLIDRKSKYESETKNKYVIQMKIYEVGNEYVVIEKETGKVIYRGTEKPSDNLLIDDNEIRIDTTMKEVPTKDNSIEISKNKDRFYISNDNVNSFIKDTEKDSSETLIKLKNGEILGETINSDNPVNAVIYLKCILRKYLQFVLDCVQ